MYDCVCESVVKTYVLSALPLQSTTIERKSHETWNETKETEYDNISKKSFVL